MLKIAKFIPNILTTLRLLLAGLFTILLPGYFSGSINMVLVLTVFSAICVSDLVDGRLARLWKVDSVFGTYLDLLVDFFYILASLLILNTLHQIPFWFTLIVLLKFIEYLVTSRILRTTQKNGEPLVKDPFGRCATTIYFLLPGLLCTLFILSDGVYRIAISFILLIACIFSVISTIHRYSLCIRAIHRMSQNPERSN
jgi:CDP-diacylglycerol--glycerol-3-phosphate 3-phosphatidyltransferase